MAKRLSFSGKLLYLLTFLFPIYIFWGYFFVSRINYSDLLSSLNNIYLGVFFLILTTLSPFIFSKLVKSDKSPDKEIFIKDSETNSKYILYIIGAISPFLTFIIEIFLRNSELHLASIIISTLVFALGGAILISKDEYGILYNLFFIRYHFVLSHGNLIVMKQRTSSGYMKVTQLNNKVYKEWN